MSIVKVGTVLVLVSAGAMTIAMFSAGIVAAATSGVSSADVGPALLASVGAEFIVLFLAPFVSFRILLTVTRHRALLCALQAVFHVFVFVGLGVATLMMFNR
jgi:hypothetical protein